MKCAVVELSGNEADRPSDREGHVHFVETSGKVGVWFSAEGI